MEAEEEEKNLGVEEELIHFPLMRSRMSSPSAL